MDKAEFIRIATVVSNLEDDRKSLNEDIKEMIETASEEKGIDKKILKKAISKYLKFQKDREKYMIEEDAVDQILHDIVKIGE